jgi:hypothetical protein
MHQYEINENPNYGYVLLKDKKEAICPFQPAIATQNEGMVNLMRIPCSTNCPMANLVEEQKTAYDIETNETVEIPSMMKKVHYVTSCGCKEQKFEIMIRVNEMKAL